MDRPLGRLWSRGTVGFRRPTKLAGSLGPVTKVGRPATPLGLFASAVHDHATSFARPQADHAQLRLDERGQLGYRR
jgi:hypothetical protein